MGKPDLYTTKTKQEVEAIFKPGKGGRKLSVVYNRDLEGNDFNHLCIILDPESGRVKTWFYGKK